MKMSIALNIKNVRTSNKTTASSSIHTTYVYMYICSRNRNSSAIWFLNNTFKLWFYHQQPQSRCRKLCSYLHMDTLCVLLSLTQLFLKCHICQIQCSISRS
jgi:hypothetical protein